MDPSTQLRKHVNQRDMQDINRSLHNIFRFNEVRVALLCVNHYILQTFDFVEVHDGC